MGSTPTAWYRLGESSGVTMFDNTSNNLDGTYQGAPTLGVAGAIVGDSDTAVDFTTIQFSEVLDTALLDITGGFTLASWVKKNGVPTSNNVGVISKWLGAGNQRSYDMFIETGTGNLGMAVSTDGTFQAGNVLTSSTSVTNNVYRFCCAVYDPSTAFRLYVDGSQVASDLTAIPASIFSGSANLWIGMTFAAATQNGLGGTEDEALVYSKVLTPTEISDLYNAGIGAGAQVGATRWLYQDTRRFSGKFNASIIVTLSTDANLTYDVELTKDRNSVDRYRNVTLSRSGTCVTVTLPDHGLNVGDNVQVFNTNDSNFEGSFDVVVVTDVDTFVYEVTDTGSTSSDGTLISFRVFPHPTLKSESTTQFGTQKNPVSGIRLKVTSFTAGRADITTLQQG